jgi:hypothetical protein
MSGDVSDDVFIRVAEQARDVYWIAIPEPADLRLELGNNVLVKKVVFFELFLLRARCGPGLAAITAVVNFLGLDIIFPGRNGHPDSVMNIELFQLIDFVFEARQQKTVETTAVISLQIADNTSIARLQL